MTSLKSFNRRVVALFAVAALVLATVTPGLVPTFASAAQVTERSVELSSSSKGATDVNYTVKFTAVTDAAATVLTFCKNTPLIGAACTSPTNFDASGASATGYTISQTAEEANNIIVVTGAIDVSEAAEVTIPLEHISNPTDAGTMFVRIVTYDTTGHAEASTPTALGAAGYVQDQGSAAISITDTVGVSGAVLESMTFCVSGSEITVANCESGLTPPTLKLGETTGDVTALTASKVSEGDIYSQISTNAVNGAVVNLQSNAKSCGGLLRAGSDEGVCDIAAAGAAGIEAGQAKFGLKVTSLTTPVGITSNGTFQGANSNAYYGSEVFKLNAAIDNNTGVTSPYGDLLLDTAGAPANNKNVKITFGASVANNTPAGLYSADLSLIATGKF